MISPRSASRGRRSLRHFPATARRRNIRWPADEACWQGEAVVAVVAATRAEAEDAIELIAIDWEELPAVPNMEIAAAAGAPARHSAKANNLGLDHTFAAGKPDQAFAEAAAVVEHDFVFERQTGVTLEPRVIVADFDPRLRQLTIHHSHQVPHQMRDVFATQLGLPLSHVRVVAPDVGGAFGMKLSAYPDEMAVAAIAVLLGRPVKFVADRLESFVSDGHAREAKVRGRLAVDAGGKLLAMEVTAVSGFGAYPNYPRGSVGEGLQTVHLSAAAYRLPNFRGQVRGYFQNKPPSGVLRGVGHPMATTVTEQLLDMAARRLSIDPAELRRRNYAEATKLDAKSVGGIVLGRAFARALPRPAAGADGLRWAAPAAGRAAQARRLSRHRACGVHRADRGRPFALWLDAGSRFRARSLPADAGARRRHPLRNQHHRSGPGHPHRAHADRRPGARHRAGWSRGRQRRHGDRSDGRRRLGVARRCAGRRGCACGPPRSSN